MNITIDLHGFQSEDSHNRGIGRYSLYLTEAIYRNITSEDNICCLLNNNYKKEIVEFHNRLPFAKCDYFYSPKPREFYASNNDCSRKISRLMLDNKYDYLNNDVNLVMSSFEGFTGNAIVSDNYGYNKNCIKASVLYDLIPLIMSDIYLKDDNVKKWYYDSIERIKKTDILFAISEATRQDAIKYLGLQPDKVVNILGSVDYKFKKIVIKNRGEFLNKFKIKDKFIMYTGGIDYRKNIDNLIRAYGELNKDVIKNTQLVIVCSIRDYDRDILLKIATESGIDKDRIIFTGFVSDDDLVKLYNLCDIFVFPSMYEGLGMPIIEAMKCGAPVIGANNSSIAEIIGLQEALFDAKNVNDIANIINRSLTDSSFREKLKQYSNIRANDFDWDKSAKIIINVLREKVEFNKKNIVDEKVNVCHKKKIAFLSPLPPDKSGIANYSEELLHGLEKHFEIDLYTDVKKSNSDFINRSFSVYNYEDLPDHIEKYDSVVYQMGNSDFHEIMYEYIQKYPGILVQHDFFISGMLHYVSCMKNVNWFKESLIYSHGFNGMKDLFLLGPDACVWKYPMNKKMLDSATGIIYHSNYSYNLYEKFYGNDYQVPSVKINQMREKVKDRISNVEAKKILGMSKDTFLITSFGFVAETKLSHIVAQGFIEFIGRYKAAKCKLVFVGGIVGDYKLQLDNIIKDRDDIEITGYIDDDKYKHYLEASDVSIQLRCKSRGEVSRAILDCFAYGVPTIVNSYATFNDYSEDVLMKIAKKPIAEEISDSLFKLYDSADLRKKYSLAGLDVIDSEHDIDMIAKQYAEFINMISDRNKNNNLSNFIEYVAKEAKITNADEQLIKEIGSSYQKNNIPYYRKRIYSMCHQLSVDMSIEKEWYENNIDIVDVELRGTDVHPVNISSSNDFVIPIDDGDTFIIQYDDINNEILCLVQSYRLNLFIFITKFDDTGKLEIIKDYISGIITDGININSEYSVISIDNYKKGKIREYIY